MSGSGMRMQEMDASLRDPEMQLDQRGEGTLLAGLVDPDLPIAFTVEELERLRIRKQLEFDLVSKLDKQKIQVRKECWFLVDSDWLNKWSSFMHLPKRLLERAQRQARKANRERRRRERAARKAARRAGNLDNSGHSSVSSMDDSTRSTDSLNSSIHSVESNASELDREAEEEEDNEPPGPISSKNLVTQDGKPIMADLKAKRDYRGVPAITYWVFVELYGKDKSPDIPRYEVDIYKPEVPVGRLVDIQFKARQEARIEVGKIRPKWMKWELSDDEEDEEDSKVCCGLTKEHFEAFIYWIVRCCFVSRKKDGRGDIKYSQYSPMQYHEGDSTHGLDSSHGGSLHSTASNMSSMNGSNHGRGRGRDRNSRHGMGGISSSSHGGSSHGGSSHGGSSHGGSSHGGSSHGGSSHGGSSHGHHNPMHNMDIESGDAHLDDDMDGLGYADRGYDSGSWVGRTRFGAWLSSFGI